MPKRTVDSVGKTTCVNITACDTSSSAHLK